MPFTAPLLAVVAGSAFDCLIEDTNGRPNPSGGSSNAYRWSNNGGGTWNVISDPKGIVQRVVDNINGDAIALTTSGTLTLTLINHPTYNSSNSSDQAGFQVVQLDSTSTTSAPGSTLNSFFVSSFSGGSNQTIEDVSLSNSGARPGLYFGIKRALGSSAMSTTGRLLIGINKT